MANYPMPAWLHGPQGDPGAEFAQGYRLSATLAMQQRQMQQERERMGMEAELRTQQLRQRALESEQQIQVDKAYKDQTIALREKQLEGVAAQVQAKTAAAARQYAGQEKYRQAIDSGMDPMDAILKFGPEMGHYGAVEAAAMRASHMRTPQPAEQGTKVNLGGEDFIQIPSTSGYKYQQIKHAKPAPQEGEEVTIEGKNFIKIPTGTGYRYQQIKEDRATTTKPQAPGTLSQIDRDEIHSLERQYDKLNGLVLADEVGAMALERNPKSPLAKAYQRKRDQADALEKRIDAIRDRARGGGNTEAKPAGKSKVERAKEIAEEHPDWTKEQIIKAVNLEFSK
jgi:hypothetical protein